MSETPDVDPIRHEINVSALSALLAELRDDDILIPNKVRNLLIVRDGKSIGFISLLADQQAIEWFDA